MRESGLFFLEACWKSESLEEKNRESVALLGSIWVGLRDFVVQIWRERCRVEGSTVSGRILSDC